MKYLWKKYETCFLIKGYNRSTVYDLQRSCYYFVTNELENVWTKLENGIDEESFDKLEKKLKDILIDNELVYKINYKLVNSFTKVNLKFDNYNHIQTIHLEFTLHFKFWSEVNYLIQNLLVDNLVIEFETLEELYLEKIKFLNKSRIKNIVLIINKKPVNFLEFQRVLNLFERVSYVFLKFYLPLKTFRTELKILPLLKGNYPSKFLVNFDLFIESQNHNPFYNKKLFIDKEGKIFTGLGKKKEKICVSKITYNQILKLTQKAKKQWQINKDKIEVCNVCEFRYMCCDIRVPQLRINTDMYYHEEECNYNPFISKWKWQEEFMTLEEIKVVSDFRGFNLDENLIREVNYKFWGE